MSQLRRALAEALDRARVKPTAAEESALLAYLDLLARWNRRINLTAFDLDSPPPGSIERLIVEPVLAVDFVRAIEGRSIDVGTGGGSPAIPVAIMRPRLRLTMFEAREKKAAFLREAVRVLGLDADVSVTRFGEGGSDDAPANLITCRAVRPDLWLIDAMEAALLPGGDVLYFGHITDHNIGWRRLDGAEISLFRRD